MKRTNKKGFTIVELVIVIAVIAILAAVLIPNISRLVRKANESNDASLAKNMNTLLTMDEAENGKATNMYDVLIALENGGFKLSTLNPRASGNVFAWDKANNQIVYLSKDKILFQAKEVKKNGDLYITTRDADTFKNFPGYSFYLVQDLEANVTLEEGSNLDTGEFTLNGNVSCKTGMDVDIRGKINGTLKVNSTEGTITNYSIVENVVIENTAITSYHEKGQVKTFTINDSLTGKVVFENSAYVETLVQNNTKPESKVENNGFIKTVSEDSKAPTDKKIAATKKDEFTIEISTFEELCNFRDKVNAGATYEGMTVKLTADIDISSRAWTPIGVEYRKYIKENSPVFRGTFDGQGHTISGLTNTGFEITSIYKKCKGSNTTTPDDYGEYVFGFFGSIVNATIKDLNMAKVNIDMACDTENKALGDSVGAIAGFAGGDSCTITNCHVLSGKINGFDATAGIIGRVHTDKKYGNDTVYNGTNAPKTTMLISNCSNAATITSSRRAAGIVGYTNFFFDGTEKIKISEGNAIVNNHRGVIIDGIVIQNCENKASVTCLNNEVELGILTDMTSGNNPTDRNENGGYHQAAGIANSNSSNTVTEMSDSFSGNKNSGSVTTLSKPSVKNARASGIFTFGDGKVSSNDGKVIADPKKS